MSDWIRRKPLSDRSDPDVEARLIAVNDGHVLYQARWPKARLKGEIIYAHGVFRMPWNYWASRYGGAIR